MTAPDLPQFRCDMCGCYFLLRSTFLRHKASEIPAFITESTAKNEAYAAYRRWYRLMNPDVPKELCDNDARSSVRRPEIQ
jgi:hypothetical protein